MLLITVEVFLSPPAGAQKSRRALSAEKCCKIYKESPLVGESPSIYLITTTVNMPSQRTFTSISSASQSSLCQQYKRVLQHSAVGYNIQGHMYARRGGDLYPTIEETLNCSNTAVPDDDEFEDLGLNDFIVAQRWIAGHRLRCRRDFMSVHTRGLISRGIEEWDVEYEPHSGEVEVLIAYVAAIGMAAMESDVMMNDRVCVSSFDFLITSVFISSCRWIT